MVVLLWQGMDRKILSRRQLCHVTILQDYQDLQRLANRLGLEIRVAHYPPYCSKHNPIEHRVFPHVTRACQGVIFHTMDIAQHCIERTKTTTGLGVTVRILDKVYETGRKYAADFKQNMKIIFDDHLPKWNYRAVPEVM
jgi:hypothetical protein